MDNLIYRLMAVAIACDARHDYAMAKLLTEAVKEIENARKGHLRNPVDESTKPEGNEQHEAGDGTGL